MSHKHEEDKEKKTATIDKDGKVQKKLRWSAVDTVIVLALLLAVAGLIFRGFFEENQDEEVSGSTCIISFTIDEIHKDVYQELRGGDWLYMYDTGEVVGYIGMYEDGSYAIVQTGVIPNTGGEMVSANVSMVGVDGLFSEGSFLPQHTEQYLSPGSVVKLRTEQAVLTARVTEIIKHS